MNFINIIDVIGTFAFAISGVLAGLKSKFDFFGVTILAFVTAVGGGTLRDVLIGVTPVGWMKSELHIWLILSTIPAAYFFIRWIRRLKRTFLIVDTIGIGVFTIVGMEKCLAVGLSPIISAFLGVVSAVFGGVIRDVLVNKVPLIFKNEIYAFACLCGALVYLGLIQFLWQEIAMIIAVLVVIVVRLLAIRFKWSMPFRPIE